MKILLRNGTLINQGEVEPTPLDILIVDGRIAALGVEIAAPDAQGIDLGGRVVSPGLVDLHVHLRDPGLTEKEDIASGGWSAAAGGFTSIVCMPNTKPPIDSVDVVLYIQEQAAVKSPVRVFVSGAITRGLAGQGLADLDNLARSGVVLFTDDGETVMNANLMRQALMRARELGLPVMPHCEDKNLSGPGVMHAGEVARQLGLPGQPASAEDVMVARDLILAGETGARLHLTHLSTARSVELVRLAKARGVKVTCDVTPHNLVLTDAAVAEVGANAKMYPPLRTEADVAALREGLADGTIDAIATDHAPHTEEEKARGCLEAPKGIVGLETTLAVCLDRLVHTGVITLPELLRKMTVNPARIIGLPQEGIVPGARADLTVIDPDYRWLVDREKFTSKGKNTPFHGWSLRGKPVLTMVGGKVVYREPGYWQGT
jgi:dihydroorotase